MKTNKNSAWKMKTRNLNGFPFFIKKKIFIILPFYAGAFFALKMKYSEGDEKA